LKVIKIKENALDGVGKNPVDRDLATELFWMKKRNKN
jgi:hypothetical protein